MFRRFFLGGISAARGKIKVSGPVGVTAAATTELAIRLSKSPLTAKFPGLPHGSEGCAGDLGNAGWQGKP